MAQKRPREVHDFWIAWPQVSRQQVKDVEALINRSRSAKRVSLLLHIDGTTESYSADWLKALKLEGE